MIPVHTKINRNSEIIIKFSVPKGNEIEDVLYALVLCFSVQASSVCIKFSYKHRFPGPQNKGVLAPYFFYYLTLHISHCMSLFGKMFSSRFCDNITLGVIPVFSHSIFEFSTGHTNIFTFWLVWAVGLDAPPVVDTVLGLTIYRLCHSVNISVCLTNYLTRIWHGKGANVAGLATLLPAWCIPVGPPSDPIKPFHRS